MGFKYSWRKVGVRWRERVERLKNDDQRKEKREEH